MTSRIHLLVVGTQDVPPGDGWLTSEERERLGSLRFLKRRQEWLLGRWAAKQAVVRAAAEEGGDALRPRDVTIRARADGSPEAVVGDMPCGSTISISHRDGMGVCAIRRGEVALGCDVERIEPRNPAFLRDYLTDLEQALVDGSPEVLRHQAATLLWSAKESALKALRVGLRADTRSVAVYLAPWPPAQEEGPDARMTPSAGSGHWLPLLTRDAASERLLGGWWQCQDHHVFTVVCDPAAGPPVTLSDRTRADLPSR